MSKLVFFVIGLVSGTYVASSRIGQQVLNRRRDEDADEVDHIGPLPEQTMTAPGQVPPFIPPTSGV